jgi:HEAT repeats
MNRPLRDRRSWNWQGSLLIGLILGLAALAVAQKSREPIHEPRVDPAPVSEALGGIGRAELGAPGLSGMAAMKQPILAASGVVNREQAISNASEVNPISDRAGSRAASAELEGHPAKEEISFELGESEQAARVAAVPKVGTLAPSEAIEVLSTVFSTEEDVLVRSRAVAALTRVEAPAATALLRSWAFDDEDSSLRAQALNALVATTGERSTTVVGRALRLDADPDVRLTAIRSLQRVGGKWAQGYLERAATDPDLRISSAAEEALAAWPESLD